MNVERQLHIVMAALAALGSLLLGMGQQNPWLPLIAASCAGLSLYFTDICGVFHLHRHLANGFALLAVILSIREFYNTTSEDQLLAIANLLIYLQLVLLFQQKSDRVYWQLIVLSVLQVVVAAALNLGFEFGVLLAIYLVIVLTALFLFFLHRETRLRPEENPEGEALGWEAIAPLSELLADKTEATTDPGAATESSPFAQVVRRTSDGRMAPTTQRPTPFFGIAREIGVMVLTTTIFAIVIFYSIPRTADASWRWSGGRRNSRVGFSPEVTLTDSGQIAADETAALRVSFLSPDGQTPYMLPEAPYIRGAVLGHYRSDGWQNPWRGGMQTFPMELDTPPRGAEIVRQEVVLESPQERTLFSVYPIHRLAATDDNIRFDLRGQRLYAKEQESAEARRTTQFRYTLGTTAFRNGVQADLTAANDLPLLTDSNPRRLIERARYMNQIQEIDLRRMARVKALADQLVANVPASDIVRRARVLENHFRLSTEYQYTLDFDSVKRNPEIDPVEDFCLNHKQGNCRYFASALALMLRAEGIPSRVVVGFRGGEYNSLGHFFVVRQKHAHAWVEAYLRRNQVPDTILPAGMEAQEGFWLRLDPTPIDGLPLTVSTEVGVLAYIGECLGYAQLLWSDYVVQLNSERQQEAIFRPFIDSVSETTSELVGADAWRDRFEAWADWIGISREGWLAKYWYVWLSLSLIIGAAGLALFLKWGQAWWWPYVAWMFRRSTEKRGRQGAAAPFFRRLELLLATHGWVRPQGQTQREFAAELAAEWKVLPRGPEAAGAVEALVEGYYLFRYAGDDLSAEDEARFDRLLAGLDRDLQIAKKPQQEVAGVLR